MGNLFIAPITRAAALLLAVLLPFASCSGDTDGGAGGPPREEAGEATARPATQPETTAHRTPKATLQEDPGGRPEVVLRLEGGPETTFSGLCSVGEDQNVLGGQVPERFAFDLRGRGLSCRIEKRDEGRGPLKVVLVVGNATRSVQQTNAPGSTINVTYRGG